MNQPQPAGDNLKGERPPGKILPFKPIRQEAALSKFPIHNLAKKGAISIHIVRKNTRGQVDLLWRVSPNRDHGEPRQLAYKLDTLAINRRIEEQGRPIPNIIRLGGINQLAKELGSTRSCPQVQPEDRLRRVSTSFF